jgi:UDP-N-acetylmuramate dehydrogenase
MVPKIPDNLRMIDRLPKVSGIYREDADLSKLCWFQVGGKAKILYKPKDARDLSCFITDKPKEIPYFILGAGSNLLIKDTGFNGVIIRLGREFNYVKFQDTKVIVGGSTLDINVSEACRDQGIAGLSFLSGIPGTIGGAIAMNAGAYGKEMKDILISAKAINEAGDIVNLKNEEFRFHYRGKELEGKWIFVEAVLQGVKGNKDEISDEISEIQKQRTITQPIKNRTGGSTFKNPVGYKAWELIDKAGCRGLKIGRAEVSPIHCNFFINTGTATAQDLEDLINEVKKRVFEKTKIRLEEEIKIIG